MIALLVITDGRDDYLSDAVSSAAQNLVGPITERWMYWSSPVSSYIHRLVSVDGYLA